MEKYFKVTTNMFVQYFEKNIKKFYFLSVEKMSVKTNNFQHFFIFVSTTRPKKLVKKGFKIELKLRLTALHLKL